MPGRFGSSASYPDTERGGHLIINLPPITTEAQLDSILSYFDERVMGFRRVLRRQVKREIALVAQRKKAGQSGSAYIGIDERR